MKPLTGYIFLFVAISCGIAANSFAKISDGFSKLTPSIACLLLMCVTMFSLAKGAQGFTILIPSLLTAISIVGCMYTLSLVMKTIPVGITYASFAGLCIIATTIVGVYKFNQMPDLYTIFGLILIITGVLIVNLLGKAN